MKGHNFDEENHNFWLWLIFLQSSCTILLVFLAKNMLLAASLDTQYRKWCKLLWSNALSHEFLGRISTHDCQPPEVENIIFIFATHWTPSKFAFDDCSAAARGWNMSLFQFRVQIGRRWAARGGASLMRRAGETDILLWINFSHRLKQSGSNLFSTLVFNIAYIREYFWTMEIFSCWQWSWRVDKQVLQQLHKG